MSTQLNMDDWSSKEILQIATIGFYEPESPLDAQIQRDDGPRISVGITPLRGPNVFYSALDGCVDPKNILRTDLRTFVRCRPAEVNVHNLKSWQKKFDSAVNTIMKNQGLAGHFECELAELSFSTDSRDFLKPSVYPPADKKAKLKVATAIVIANPEDKYSGGKIRIKSAHHGKHQDYDLQTNSKKGLISVLLCFDDPWTKVETEPVRDGHRLHLIYNVYIVKPEGLTITSTKRMRQLNTNVEHLTLNPSFRTATGQNPVFLTLMQILAQTYKYALKPPAVVLQFYCQVIEGLYEQTKALFATGKPYPANVRTARASDPRLLYELREKVRCVIQCHGGTKPLYQTIALHSEEKATQCTTLLVKLGFANVQSDTDLIIAL